MQLLKNREGRIRVAKALLLSMLVMFIVAFAFVLWLKMMMWHILN